MSRATQAASILRTYSLASGGAGLVTVPFLSMAALTTLHLALIRDLARVYDVELSTGSTGRHWSDRLGRDGESVSSCDLRPWEDADWALRIRRHARRLRRQALASGRRVPVQGGQAGGADGLSGENTALWHGANRSAGHSVSSVPNRWLCS